MNKLLWIGTQHQLDTGNPRMTFNVIDGDPQISLLISGNVQPGETYMICM